MTEPTDHSQSGGRKFFTGAERFEDEREYRFGVRRADDSWEIPPTLGSVEEAERERDRLNGALDPVTIEFSREEIEALYRSTEEQRSIVASLTQTDVREHYESTPYFGAVKKIGEALDG